MKIHNDLNDCYHERIFGLKFCEIKSLNKYWMDFVAFILVNDALKRQNLLFALPVYLD